MVMALVGWAFALSGASLALSIWALMRMAALERESADFSRRLSLLEHDLKTSEWMR